MTVKVFQYHHLLCFKQIYSKIYYYIYFYIFLQEQEQKQVKHQEKALQIPTLFTDPEFSKPPYDINLEQALSLHPDKYVKCVMGTMTHHAV